MKNVNSRPTDVKPTVKVSEILDKFPHLTRLHAGPNDNAIVAPSSMEHPQRGSICYLSKDEHLDTCIRAGVSALVIAENLKEYLPQESCISILISENVHVAMAQINSFFFSAQKPPHPFDGQNIHPAAILSSSVQIGQNVIIGPNTVIEDGAIIGNDVRIGANTTIRASSSIGKSTVIGSNTTIEPRVEIGSHCYIHSQVYIGRECKIGNSCVIQPQTSIGSEGYGYATDKNNHHYHKPHYGRVVLEDRVEIGSGVFIDRGTFVDSVIGEGSKIDNYCHLGHNLTLGKNTLITAGLITAGSVKIGNDCVFAGRTTINGHIEISDKVFVGPLSGVSNSIKEPGQYGGWPLQSYKESIKTLASLRFLSNMKKDILSLKRKLNLDSKEDKKIE